MQSCVEGYGYKLTASYLHPQKCSTLIPGIAIKNSASSQHSLSFPLKDSDITAIKHLSRFYTDSHGTGKGQSYYLPAELLSIKNLEFTRLVEGKINEIVKQFCENIDLTTIEVRLLGARLLDSSTGNRVGDVSDGPIASVSDPDLEQLCATICIQVRL